MEIVQNKKSNKHTFTFFDDHFNFAYEDKTGSDDTDMDYADFPQKAAIRIEQNEWLRNVGLLWCTLGIFQLGYAIFSGSSLSGKGFWILVGLVCIGWAHFSKVKYSVFRSESASIFVIHDKKHDRIIDELNSRRKSQLLNWYGEINPENDLNNELGKFKWLADQGVITKEELEQKIAQVEYQHKEKHEIPSEHLN